MEEDVEALPLVVPPSNVTVFEGHMSEVQQNLNPEP